MHGINFSIMPTGFCSKIFDAIISIPRFAKKMRRPKGTIDEEIEKIKDNDNKTMPIIYVFFSFSVINCKK